MFSCVWHIQGMLASFKKESFTINSIPIRVLLVVLIELIHVRDTTPLSLSLSGLVFHGECGDHVRVSPNPNPAGRGSINGAREGHV